MMNVLEVVMTYRCSHVVWGASSRSKFRLYCTGVLCLLRHYFFYAQVVLVLGGDFDPNTSGGALQLLVVLMMMTMGVTALTQLPWDLKNFEEWRTRYRRTEIITILIHNLLRVQ
jgi:hypothetical protein